METLAFYSYKGGVGRSLLLANAARFLATLGKGVVALDFDFEAPGLHYKLGELYGGRRRGAQRRREFRRKGGVVPYLLSTAEGNKPLPSLKPHLVDIPVPPDSRGWLRLMPAGPAPERAYWAALKDLGDRLQFDDPSEKSLLAVLDLQARIEEELKPDYLLIDARTGVTEIGALATTILADTVVCMFVANQESVDGTLTVAEALKSAPRLKGQHPVRVVPVLSRLTEKLGEDPEFTPGVRQLLKLGEGKNTNDQEKRQLLTLPHDDLVGAEEKLVAGERRASAFSPLYKAYLELFQELFPLGAEQAQQALERLEAVASVKQDLTEPRRGRASEDLLSLWSPDAIDEGVVYQAKRQKEAGSRYADLICRDEGGRPLMVVEYSAEESEQEAKSFWERHSGARCLVLVRQRQHGASRNILTRGPNQGELKQTHRWDLPMPKEFEILPDVGDRSVEALLDALRRGHAEAATWLIDEWQESMPGAWFPKGPRWRPGRARRILDGLAMIEDAGSAEQILRRAAGGGLQPWREGWRWKRRRFDDFAGDEIDRWLEEELFAPLFWRLPVEAVLRYLKPKHHPGELPCLAGYRLLAHRLMGLHYDPQGAALTDGQRIATRVALTGEIREGGDGEFPLHWLHRSQRDLIEQIHISDDLPPVLVWDEILRREPWWRGTLEEARVKVEEGTRNSSDSVGLLRRRVRVAAERRDLVTQGLLGYYESPGRMILYASSITATAEHLNLSTRYLKSVVFIYLSVLALAHQARDLDGELGYGFAPTSDPSSLLRESPLHVSLAQAFSHRLIRKLEDANLMAAFEKLSQHQSEPYRQWISLRTLPVEKLRELLLRARASTVAVGLPQPGEQV